MLSKTIVVLTFLYVAKAGVITVNDENENAAENAVVQTPSRACTASLCSQLCRQLGFQNGVCISASICQCSGPRAFMGDQQQTPDEYDGKKLEIDLEKCSQDESNSDVIESDIDHVATHPAQESSVRSCTASLCSQLCRQLGFQNGVCISASVCRCSGRRALTDDKPELKDNYDGRDVEFDFVKDAPALAGVDDAVSKISDDDVEDAPLSTRACTASICTQLCRQLGFQNGVCISPSVCRCSGRMHLTRT